jgi:hypothetical protein
MGDQVSTEGLENPQNVPYPRILQLVTIRENEVHSLCFVPAVNDDLVNDCLSVLYNCCICVSTLAAGHHFVKKKE